MAPQQVVYCTAPRTVTLKNTCVTQGRAVVVDVEEVDDVEEELVLLLLVLLVVDVVADVPTIGSVIKFVHVPFDTILMSVAALGTLYDVYPATKDAFGILNSNGAVYPSASEYRSKGPVSVPAIVSVITTVCAICYGIVVVVDVVVQSAQSPVV